MCTAWTYLHLHIHVNSVCIRIIYCTFTYIFHVYRSIPVCSMSGQIILHTSPNVANIYGDIPHVLLGVTCPDICPIVFWPNINICYKPNRIHVWYIYLHLVDLYGKYTMHGSYGYVHNIQNSITIKVRSTLLYLCVLSVLVMIVWFKVMSFGYRGDLLPNDVFPNLVIDPSSSHTIVYVVVYGIIRLGTTATSRVSSQGVTQIFPLNTWIISQ